jgi:predicted transcriptional regulator
MSSQSYLPSNDAEKQLGINERTLLDQHPASTIERRVSLGTYCDILEAIASGLSKPTNIMLRAKLSCLRFHEFVEKLDALGLVERIDTGDEGRKEYSLSNEGFRILHLFRSIKRDLNLDVE